MEITLNDNKEIIDDNSTIETLIGKLYGDKPQGIAVALNNQLVKREKWSATAINPNDEIIIINAAYGG